jgi:predicted RNA-binding Zn ribbon-like protein
MAPFEKIEFEFIAGYLCLDFVNTLIKQQGQPVDLLSDLDALLAWLVQADLIDLEAASSAGDLWRNSTTADELLQRARTFRRTLRDMVDAIIDRQVVESETLVAINQLLQARNGYLQIVADQGRFITRFHHVIDAPLHLLAPLAAITADLLTTADMALIKRCGNPECVRYFYDSTKNHSRRWCDMTGCGNRMKVAAYYARKSRAAASNS